MYPFSGISQGRELVPYPKEPRGQVLQCNMLMQDLTPLFRWEYPFSAGTMQWKVERIDLNALFECEPIQAC
jgi:hypothetical protein